MSRLRLLGDAIELDGAVIATIVLNLRLSQRDQLEEAFDAIDEDRIGELEAKLDETA